MLRATFGGAATQTVEYQYDYLNQLVGRTLDADGNPGTTSDIQQTKYAFDNDQVALQFEKTGTGNLTATDLSNRYLWGPAVDQLFADEQVDWSDNDADGEVLWVLTDHLGSVRDLVDNSGTLQNHKSYDAFGNVTSGSSAVDTAFGYTGKLFDDATGLQNNLNRWYDPKVGRWLSEDPSSFTGGDANLYRYVGNAPTTHTDPTGEIWQILGGALAGGIIGGAVAWWTGGDIKDIVGAAVGGAVGGAVSAATFGVGSVIVAGAEGGMSVIAGGGVGVVSGAVGGAVGAVGQEIVDIGFGDEPDVSNICYSALTGAITGGVTGIIVGPIPPGMPVGDLPAAVFELQWGATMGIWQGVGGQLDEVFD